MFADCLISMMLMVTPATSGMEPYLPTTWLYDRAFLGGICVNMMEPKNEAAILITDHQLIITYARQRYVIPLPPNAMTALSSSTKKEYRLIYVLGEQYARIGDRYKIMVQMGPVGWQ